MQSLTKWQPNPKPHWGVHLTKGQPDAKSDQISTGPEASSGGDGSTSD